MKQRKTPLAANKWRCSSFKSFASQGGEILMKLKIKTKVFELAFEMNVIQLVGAILMFFS
jgi:hypothetical protein